VKHNLFNVLYY